MRPVTDLQRKVAPFTVVTEMVPAGDQPTAIAEIERRVRAGEKDTRPAWRDRNRQDGDRGVARRTAAAPRPRHAAQQDARRPVRQRAPRDAAGQRRRVLRLVLRLLPARGLRPADRHLHREGLLDQRRGGAAAALGDQLAAHPPGHDRRRVGVVHLRPGHAAGVRGPHAQGAGRRHGRPGRHAPAPGRDAVRPQRHVVHPGHLPGAGRHDRDHPAVRGTRRPDRDVRRRDRAAVHAAPADRRGDQRGPGTLRFPGEPLRRGRAADGTRHRGYRGRAGRAARRAGTFRQAARGATAAHAHHLRHRDDAPGRQLLGHRELLAAHRRP